MANTKIVVYKKKRDKYTAFFIGFLIVFTLLVVFIATQLQYQRNVSLQKPKAECPCNSCPAGLAGPDAYCGCVGPNGAGYINVHRQSYCTNPTGSTEPCTINYSDKCIILTGNCSGRTVRTFTGPYGGGCPNQGGSDQPAAGGNSYCANASYGQCVQVDLLGGGGKCDCKPGNNTQINNTPTPLPTPTVPPNIVLTPTSPPAITTLTPTPTKTPTATPTPTSAPSATPTTAPTPTTSVPTPTLVPNTCGTKGCDNTTNPCRSGLICMQASDGSNYCAMPDYQTACSANPSQTTCCTAPTPTSVQMVSNPTPTPTEILLAQSVNTPAPTKVPTIPSTGAPAPWIFLSAPLGLLLLGLLF